MRFLSTRQKDLLSQLHQLAGGNAQLVNDAIRHAAAAARDRSAKQAQPELDEIIDYILERIPAEEVQA